MRGKSGKGTAKLTSKEAEEIENHKWLLQGIWGAANIIRDKYPCNGQIYFMQGKMTRRIKIGFTEGISKRFGDIQVNSPDDLEIIAKCPGHMQYETALHTLFRKFRVRDEWFVPADNILAYIEQEIFLEQKTQAEFDQYWKEFEQRRNDVLVRYGCRVVDNSIVGPWDEFTPKERANIMCQYYGPPPLVLKERSISVRFDDLSLYPCMWSLKPNEDGFYVDP